MDTSKIIKGVVNGRNYTVTSPIVKEDYGLVLKIEGVELPPTYQVDFSNSENNGTSVTMIGNADGVLIPRQFIDTGKDIFAFLYHVGSDFGRTVYKFRIPNKVRPDRTNEEPTPEEQSTIDQAISALNEAVESAQDAQEAIENMSVSAQTLAEGESATVTKTEQDGVVHLAFGIPTGATGAQGIQGPKGDKGDTGAQGIQGEQGIQGIQGEKGDKGDKGDTGIGEKGDKGDKGEKGDTGASGRDGVDGQDGYSPTVTITPITGGHRITITDADGEHSADVMDGTGRVDDVQINGTSIVEDGVANVPVATMPTSGTDAGNLGLTCFKRGRGISINTTDNSLYIDYPSLAQVKAGNDVFKPVTTAHQHESTFYGLAKASGDTTQSASSNAVGNYTEDAKSAISEMLNGSVAVSGTTPTIVAKSGIRYVCGEVATLDFTPPSSGICDVVFESGATATVLTITGTVKWANGFDPTALEANTTYELNIMDGLGVAVVWT